MNVATGGPTRDEIAALPADVRDRLPVWGAAYRNLNALGREHRRRFVPWTSITVTDHDVATYRASIDRHLIKQRRAWALYIAFTATRPEADALEAQLRDVRARCEQLRLRADLGTELAETQSRCLELSAKLLTDDRFSGADTAPLPIPGPRRVPSRREAS